MVGPCPAATKGPGKQDHHWAQVSYKRKERCWWPWEKKTCKALKCPAHPVAPNRSASQQMAMPARVHTPSLAKWSRWPQLPACIPTVSENGELNRTFPVCSLVMLVIQLYSCFHWYSPEHLPVPWCGETGTYQVPAWPYQCRHLKKYIYLSVLQPMQLTFPNQLLCTVLWVLIHWLWALRQVNDKQICAAWFLCILEHAWLSLWLCAAWHY